MYESFATHMSSKLLTMDVARPHRSVVPTLHGEVLITLAGTTKPLTGREVARLVHRGSQKAVALTLDRLVEQGLVDRERAGRAYLHVLNRDHLAAPAIDVLAAMRNELLARLRAILAEWSPAPVHASLFGSAARADGDTSSDIDLLVVRPDGIDDEDLDWRAQVDALVSSVQRWTGNDASVIELSETEFRELPRHRPPILQDLREDGLDLAGTALVDVLDDR